MHLMYVLAFGAAGTCIDLEASFLVPVDLVLAALLSARMGPVRVGMVLPGKHIDSETVRIASKAHWEPLLEAGVEMGRRSPAPSTRPPPAIPASSAPAQRAPVRASRKPEARGTDRRPVQGAAARRQLLLAAVA